MERTIVIDEIDTPVTFKFDGFEFSVSIDMDDTSEEKALVIHKTRKPSRKNSSVTITPRCGNAVEIQ